MACPEGAFVYPGEGRSPGNVATRSNSGPTAERSLGEKRLARWAEKAMRVVDRSTRAAPFAG